MDPGLPASAEITFAIDGIEQPASQWIDGRHHNLGAALGAVGDARNRSRGVANSNASSCSDTFARRATHNLRKIFPRQVCVECRLLTVRNPLLRQGFKVSFLVVIIRTPTRIISRESRMLPKPEIEPILIVTEEVRLAIVSGSRPSTIAVDHVRCESWRCDSQVRPTHHHLAPTVLCQLFSLCAIWHALGKPSHDRPAALPTISLRFRCCASRRLEPSVWDRPNTQASANSRGGSAVTVHCPISRGSLLRSRQRRSASGQIVHTQRENGGNDGKTDNPTERPKIVLATSIAAGRWKGIRWSNATGFAGIALRGARHSKPK